MNICGSFRLLDENLRPRFKSRRRAIPPVKPAEGDCFVVGPAATDDWAGRDGAMAAMLDGRWEFVNPAPGCRVWIADEKLSLVFDGFHWTTVELTEV